MIKNVVSVLALTLVLLSCSQNKYFQFENNGGGMPHSALYKITLSNDTLFLLGIEKLKFSGDYYIILDKKEKKSGWIELINWS